MATIIGETERDVSVKLNFSLKFFFLWVCICMHFGQGVRVKVRKRLLWVDFLMLPCGIRLQSAGLYASTVNH